MSARGSIPEDDQQLWTALYDGPGNGKEVALSLVVSPDSSTVFVTGYSHSSDYDSDYATVAYSAASGAELWIARYDGPGNSDDYASSLAVSPNGSTVFVTGYSSSPGFDYATVAYSAATGAELWTARYNGPENSVDYTTSLAVSPDGSKVFVTGSGYSYSSNFDYVTVAYSAATGTELWTARYDGPGNSADYALALAVSPDGSTIFVTGMTFGGAMGLDYATVAYSAASGTELWTARYNNGQGNDHDSARALVVSPDGSKVFVTGDSDSTEDRSDYATVAYSAATGAELWIARYNGPRNSTDYASSLAVRPDGSKVFVTGYSHSSDSDYDYATVAYSTATGAELWTARYNGQGNGLNWAWALAVSPDGSKVFVTGRSDGPEGTSDYATVAYRASGCANGHDEAGPLSGEVRRTVTSQSGAEPYVHGVNCDLVAANGL